MFLEEYKGVNNANLEQSYSHYKIFKKELCQINLIFCRKSTILVVIGSGETTYLDFNVVFYSFT